jgi:nucleotide-binding universal stress UspA family protein
MKRFKNILCVVEPQGKATLVLEHAVRLAENNQASLTVVSVAPHVTAGVGMPDRGPAQAQLQAAVVDEHKQHLEEVVEPYKKRVSLQTRVLVGMPFLEIIREVLRNSRDIVVKLPEQQKWRDRLFGSEDMHILRKCPCPVWLIKPSAPSAYRRILASVDVDDDYPPKEMETRRGLNREIIELASALAIAELAELHVAHAWDAIGESNMRHGAFMRTAEKSVDAWVAQVQRHHETKLDDLMREAADIVGQDALDYLEHQLHMVKGPARKEIPALANRINADLIVMGTVARTGVPGFIMGNTAETILNHLDCSVLALKPPGFKSPVTVES